MLSSQYSTTLLNMAIYWYSAMPLCKCNKNNSAHDVKLITTVSCVTTGSSVFTRRWKSCMRLLFDSYLMRLSSTLAKCVVDVMRESWSLVGPTPVSLLHSEWWEWWIYIFCGGWILLRQVNILLVSLLQQIRSHKFCQMFLCMIHRSSCRENNTRRWHTGSERITTKGNFLYL